MKILQIALGKQHDIRDALAEHGEVVYWDWSGHDRTFNDSLTKLVDEHNLDFVFMQIQTPGILSPKTAELLSKKTKLINWTGDVRFPTPHWFVEVGRYCHLTLFTNMHDVEFCRAHGIKSDYLQIGFPEKIFKPEGRKAANIPEIVFLGNNVGGFPLSQLRVDMVRKLKERYGNRFGVYGINWGAGVHSINDQEDEAAVYRSTKIAINLSHFDYSRYTSDRMLRAMGSGCFVLSHNYKDIDQEFEDDKHLEVWNDFTELFDGIDFYLSSEERRLEIAKKGCELLHSKHTWRNRIEQLMKMI